jgi:hypothetical protein
MDLLCKLRWLVCVDSAHTSHHSVRNPKHAGKQKHTRATTTKHSTTRNNTEEHKTYNFKLFYQEPNLGFKNVHDLRATKYWKQYNNLRESSFIVDDGHMWPKHVNTVHVQIWSKWCSK